MSEIIVDIELENFHDRTLAKAGRLPEADIRRVAIPAVADTAVMMLAVPEDVVSRLGLKLIDSVAVMYADGRREVLPVAGPLTVWICGRWTTTECIVLSQGADAQIGHIITRRLDLIPDPESKTLGPRPESPDRPLIRL